MHRYKGSVAAITGAASGMGRRIALPLADEGANIHGRIISADLGLTAG
jgi:NAD(P)-dependent dehydrogenase (short-subunit alcohol dehydrogenase family)